MNNNIPNISPFQKFRLAILGKHNVMVLQDILKIFQYQQQSKLSQKQKQLVQEADRIMQTSLGVGAGIALISPMLARRAFPIVYGGSRLRGIIANLSLTMVSLAIGFYLCAKLVQPKIKPIKKQLLINFDKNFIEHIKNLDKQYGISYKQQLVHVLNKDQYEIWEGKKHLYL